MIMEIAESLYFNMAMANLNVAVDRLGKLLDEKESSTEARGLPWAGLCCTYSRCVHKNVWRDSVAKERVRSELIPLLARTQEAVSKLLDSSSISAEDKEEIGRYSENIRLRRGNLTQRYLNDAASCFPADVIEPRLARG